MIVLLTTRTFGASLRLMPPPSWVDTLLTTMLLNTFIGRAAAAGHQEPDAATVVVGHVGLDLVGVDVHRPGPGDSVVGSAGSWPAIMTPPPSSLE